MSEREYLCPLCGEKLQRCRAAMGLAGETWSLLDVDEKPFWRCACQRVKVFVIEDDVPVTRYLAEVFA